MGVMYYILSPFSWLLNFFYSFTDSYGISLILFALVIKIILFPLTIKGKKGMIQMNLLSGKMQQLQKQYGKDRERYNMEVQRLYEREKVNPMSGCLWSFLPILILLPLYAIIRQPLLYLMGLDSNQIAQVAASVDWQTLAVNHGWSLPMPWPSWWSSSTRGRSPPCSRMWAITSCIWPLWSMRTPCPPSPPPWERAPGSL